ncbi:DUF222 domain-containing protein [Babesia caballi]|uniref:DUF222 domain-containing protein n=1 Tax=Babesia caballi TaxID=5871 RepID=A0AAV4LLP3_BABCB|nr:DUF222 domain-containing protein [Babesia caballi]
MSKRPRSSHSRFDDHSRNANPRPSQCLRRRRTCPQQPPRNTEQTDRHEPSLKPEIPPNVLLHRVDGILLAAVRVNPGGKVRLPARVAPVQQYDNALVLLGANAPPYRLVDCTVGLPEVPVVRLGVRLVVPPGRVHLRRNNRGKGQPHENEGRQFQVEPLGRVAPEHGEEHERAPLVQLREQRRELRRLGGLLVEAHVLEQHDALQDADVALPPRRRLEGRLLPELHARDQRAPVREEDEGAPRQHLHEARDGVPQLHEELPALEVAEVALDDGALGPRVHVRHRVNGQLVLVQRLRRRYDVLPQAPLELRAQARHHRRYRRQRPRGDDDAPRVLRQLAEDGRGVHQPHAQAVPAPAADHDAHVVALGRVAEEHHDRQHVLQVLHGVLRELDPVVAQRLHVRPDLEHAAVDDVDLGHVEAELVDEVGGAAQRVGGPVVPVPAVEHALGAVAAPPSAALLPRLHERVQPLHQLLDKRDNPVQRVVDVRVQLARALVVRAVAHVDVVQRPHLGPDRQQPPQHAPEHVERDVARRLLEADVFQVVPLVEDEDRVAYVPERAVAPRSADVGLLVDDLHDLVLHVVVLAVGEQQHRHLVGYHVALNHAVGVDGVGVGADDEVGHLRQRLGRVVRADAPFPRRFLRRRRRLEKLRDHVPLLLRLRLLHFVARAANAVARVVRPGPERDEVLHVPGRVVPAQHAERRSDGVVLAAQVDVVRAERLLSLGPRARYPPAARFRVPPRVGPRTVDVGHQLPALRHHPRLRLHLRPVQLRLVARVRLLLPRPVYAQLQPRRHAAALGPEPALLDGRHDLLDLRVRPRQVYHPGLDLGEDVALRRRASHRRRREGRAVARAAPRLRIASGIRAAEPLRAAADGRVPEHRR